MNYLVASGTLLLLLADQVVRVRATEADAPPLDLLGDAVSLTFYSANTSPLGDSTVDSSALLFVPRWEGLSAPDDIVCFAGEASSAGGLGGLDPGVRSKYGGGGEQCGAANGCGVHVHSGTDCSTTQTQGGHWYDEDALTDDPWKYVGYKQTSSDASAHYASCVRTGYNVANSPDLLVGRAFIVHAEDGSRVSCGLISQMPVPGMTVYEADTKSIPMLDSGVTGQVAVLADMIFPIYGACYVGTAQGLQPNVKSFLLSAQSEQCKAKNGCGAHIHAGTSCATKDTQGGHYYSGTDLAEDPWLLESYWSTDEDGSAALVGCVITGEMAVDYGSRPFIVHGEDGTRLSCGPLESSPKSSTKFSTKSSTKSGAGRAGIISAAAGAAAFVFALL